MYSIHRNFAPGIWVSEWAENYCSRGLHFWNLTRNCTSSWLEFPDRLLYTNTHIPSCWLQGAWVQGKGFTDVPGTVSKGFFSSFISGLLYAAGSWTLGILDPLGAARAPPRPAPWRVQLSPPWLLCQARVALNGRPLGEDVAVRRGALSPANLPAPHGVAALARALVLGSVTEMAWAIRWAASAKALETSLTAPALDRVLESGPLRSGVPLLLLHPRLPIMAATRVPTGATSHGQACWTRRGRRVCDRSEWDRRILSWTSPPAFESG